MLTKAQNWWKRSDKNLLYGVLLLNYGIVMNRIVSICCRKMNHILEKIFIYNLFQVSEGIC